MDKAHPAPGAAPMGLAVFLVSLGVLFAASLVAYLAVRLPAGASWVPEGVEGLPRTLWLSTGILLLSSLTMHHALSGVRAGDQAALRRGMALTTALGAAFLVCQALSWSALIASQVTGRETLFGWTFYLLTALHALHIVGGLIPLLVTTVRSRRGAYTAEAHTGVQLCAMYWHFLDAVWIVLFATLTVYS